MVPTRRVLLTVDKAMFDLSRIENSLPPPISGSESLAPPPSSLLWCQRRVPGFLDRFLGYRGDCRRQRRLSNLLEAVDSSAFLWRRKESRGFDGSMPLVNLRLCLTKGTYVHRLEGQEGGCSPNLRVSWWEELLTKRMASLRGWSSFLDWSFSSRCWRSTVGLHW